MSPTKNATTTTAIDQAKFVPRIGIPYLTIVTGAAADGYRVHKIAREDYDTGPNIGMVATCVNCKRAIATVYRSESGPGVDSCVCNTATEESEAAIERLKEKLKLRSSEPVTADNVAAAMAMLGGARRMEA